MRRDCYHVRRDCYHWIGGREGRSGYFHRNWPSDMGDIRTMSASNSVDMVRSFLEKFYA